MEQALSEPRQTLLCRNCGHDAVEKFCARCGQENTHHVLPLGDVLRDLLDEFIKFDSRLLVTLKPLLTRPGFLTNEFLMGRRAGYIAPLRLYFMVSTVYFLAFSFHVAGQLQHSFEMPPSLSAPAVLQARTDPATGKTASIPSAASSTEAQAKRARKERLLRKLQTRMAEGGKWFVDHMTTITIFMIPAYAFLLQLLYFRSRRLYMEHLVFMLHLQAFSFLIALPVLLLARDFMTWNIWLNVTVNSAYMFFAMRRVYNQGAWKTSLKVVLLLLGEFLTAGLAGMIIVLTFILRS